MEQPSDPWLPAWDGSLYAANTAHHRVYDSAFLATLPLAPTDRILDLGCGSGDFTRTVADLVPDGHVLGLDAQPTMLDEARAAAGPNQSFVLGPVQELAPLVAGHVAEHGPFDVVMSRAVLHWVPWADHAGVLAAAHAVLRPGGWLRIECGGAGNIPRVQPVLDEESARLGGPTAPWTFADAGSYLELVEAAGFTIDPTVTGDAPSGAYVRTVAQHRAFDRDSLLGWLHSQCFMAYEAGMAPETHAPFRAAVDARVDEWRRADGTYDQSWVRLDLLVRKAPAA